MLHPIQHHRNEMTVAPLHPLSQKPLEALTRKVFINDLVLDCLIGVHRHEKDGCQRIRINIELTVVENAAPIEDKLSNVLCYENLIGRVRKLVSTGHVNLVETLAQRLADLCLSEPQVNTARVRIEKLDVFLDAASVGVEIIRTNQST
tara:strand:- start:1851 stop:2294 length:444 start_codon:yes stop_codon:yes gene_type:complete